MHLLFIKFMFFFFVSVCNLNDIALSSYHFQKGTELTEGFAMVIFLKESELHWKKVIIVIGCMSQLVHWCIYFRKSSYEDVRANLYRKAVYPKP